MNIIGIDIGGTNISAVLCNENGIVIESFNRKTAYYENDYLRNILEIIQILINFSFYACFNNRSRCAWYC